MIAAYDVFRMEADAPIWCAACETLAEAKQVVADRSAEDKSNYLIMNLLSGARIELPSSMGFATDDLGSP